MSGSASRSNRRATAALCVSMLTMQGCSTPSVDSKPVTELKDAKPPIELTEPCASPVAIEGALNVGAVLDNWGQDRAELASCGGKLKGLADYISGLIKRLSSK